MSISECHMQKKRKYLPKKNMNNFVTVVNILNIFYRFFGIKPRKREKICLGYS